MPDYNNVFYTNTYLKFVEESERVKINYFKFNENENFAILPYIVRDNILYSLRYGGIWTNSDKEDFIKEVRCSFLKYCKAQNIKRIEIRNNPFIKTIKIGKVIKKEPFVYIYLKKNDNELKNDISKSHAKCIQEAIKERLIFKETADLKYLKTFHQFYKKILERKGIVPQDFSYFMRMFFYLKNNLNLVCIKYKNKIIAASIIFKSNDNVFMTYGGMNEIGYEKYAKHFMIYNLIFKYKKRGYERLVLGTGSNGRDSIYRFKRGFTDRDHYIYTYGANI